MAAAAPRIFRLFPAGMRGKPCVPGMLAFVFLLSAGAGAAQAASQHGFDTERIHGYYKDGDFDKVIRDLEGFQKSGRKCLHSDSLFLEKHLAVVYASNPATRELGRYHMHKLLDVFPSADLIDMFVGEEVDAVFDKVRKEHAFGKAVPNTAGTRTLAVTKVPKPAIPGAMPPAPRAAPVADRTAPESDREDRLALARADLNQAAAQDTGSEATWKDAAPLIGGATAVALLAITLYFAGSSKESPSKTYVVPATASR